MCRMEALSVRFHFRGRMVWSDDEKMWNYIGGRSGSLAVPVANLSIAELKKHLADHVMINDEALEDTTLSWRLVEPEKKFTCMCSLIDNTTVNNMARHVTRVADGFVEIFARMPEKVMSDSSEEEDAIEEEQLEHVEGQQVEDEDK